MNGAPHFGGLLCGEGMQVEAQASIHSGERVSGGLAEPPVAEWTAIVPVDHVASLDVELQERLELLPGVWPGSDPRRLGPGSAWVGGGRLIGQTGGRGRGEGV